MRRIHLYRFSLALLTGALLLAVNDAYILRRVCDRGAIRYRSVQEENGQLRAQNAHLRDQISTVLGSRDSYIRELELIRQFGGSMPEGETIRILKEDNQRLRVELAQVCKGIPKTDTEWRAYDDCFGSSSDTHSRRYLPPGIKLLDSDVAIGKEVNGQKYYRVGGPLHKSNRRP